MSHKSEELICSVILPAYNVSKYMDKSLESIVNQTLKNIEIIFVNDGSKDDTLDKAKEWASKDSRIKIIEQENAGSGAARNRGLDEAKGKYVYFMDPDDIIESNTLEENIGHAEKHNSDIVIFSYWVETFDSEGNRTNQQDVFLRMEGLYSDEEFHNTLSEFVSIPMNVWNRIYRREFLQKNNCRFKTYSIGQDIAFNCLVNSKHVTNVFATREHYYHYIIRNNSAINRFHKLKVDTPFYLAEEYKAMINALGKQDDQRFVGMLNFVYLRDFSTALRNICLVNSGYSCSQIVEWIRKQREENELLEKAISNIPFQFFTSRNERIKFRILRARLHFLLVLIQRYSSVIASPKW